MPPISVLVKPASGNCNLRCDYCFYCDEAARRERASYGMMSEQTLKNVIRRTLLRAEGFYSLAFQGGEPTLCGLDFFEKVIAYVRQYNQKGVPIYLALQTNGYLLDERWCRFLSENHVLTGISIDGTGAIHNGYRHPKDGGVSYERALHSIDLMERFGVDFNVLTVVHRAVAENIREIYADYRRRGWNYLQFITCLDPLGEPRGRQAYSLTPELYGRFLIELFELWYEEARRNTEPYIRQFDNYLGILLGYPPEACEQCGRCGVSYTVEADGGVYPCDFYVLDEWRLGSFNTDLLPQIDARREELGFVKRSENQPPECLECRWFPLCRGACFRSRLTGEDARLGEGPEGLNYFCPSYQMFFESCYGRLCEIAALRQRRT